MSFRIKRFFPQFLIFIDLFKKTVKSVLVLYLILNIFACSSPPRSVNYYDYNIPKENVLRICMNSLIKLGYEIDIFAPESNLLITKSTKLRKVRRRYDYIIYLQITDNVELHIARQKRTWPVIKIFRYFKSKILRSIFGRSSNKRIIEQSESNMPDRLQRIIFDPIRTSFERNNIKLIKIS